MTQKFSRESIYLEKTIVYKLKFRNKKVQLKEMLSYSICYFAVNIYE